MFKGDNTYCIANVMKQNVSGSLLIYKKTQTNKDFLLIPAILVPYGGIISNSTFTKPWTPVFPALTIFNGDTEYMQGSIFSIQWFCCSNLATLTVYCKARVVGTDLIHKLCINKNISINRSNLQ